MRKKWGIILGLTGMMLLGSQSIYAAEAADGTAETTDAANEKETAGTDDIAVSYTHLDVYKRQATFSAWMRI